MLIVWLDFETALLKSLKKTQNAGLGWVRKGVIIPFLPSIVVIECQQGNYI